MTIEVVVSDRKEEATNICSFKFDAVEGVKLPLFDPGSHIDVYLPNGLIRQYSLCEKDGYRIAVLKDPSSRGGSAWLHQNVKPGSRLHISVPRNTFGLDSSMDHVILAAGGIGITPLMCMADRLASEKRSFELHYCTRSRERAAFLGRLSSETFARHTRLYFDDTPLSGRFAADKVLERPHGKRGLYICGPSGFIDLVRASAKNAGWADENIRLELFSKPTDDSTNQAFDVFLARSNLTVHVPAHLTLAEALIGAGIDIPLSCEQGLCGTCVTKVLGGQPIHRDQILKERAVAEGLITPCVSRAHKSGLVLDL